MAEVNNEFGRKDFKVDDCNSVYLVVNDSQLLKHEDFWK